MTTKKFSQFDETTSTLDTDFLPLLRTSDPSPASRNKKVSLLNLSTNIASKVSSPVTFPTTPAIQDVDGVSIAQSGAPRKVLFSVLFETIRSKLFTSKNIDFTFSYNDGNTVQSLKTYTFDVLVNGCQIGDFVNVSYPFVGDGIIVNSHVITANNVRVTYFNTSTASVVVPDHNLNIRIDRKTAV